MTAYFCWLGVGTNKKNVFMKILHKKFATALNNFNYAILQYEQMQKSPGITRKEIIDFF